MRQQDFINVMLGAVLEVFGQVGVYTAHVLKGLSQLTYRFCN